MYEKSTIVNPIPYRYYKYNTNSEYWATGFSAVDEDVIEFPEDSISCREFLIGYLHALKQEIFEDAKYKVDMEMLRNILKRLDDDTNLDQAIADRRFLFNYIMEK